MKRQAVCISIAFIMGIAVAKALTPSLFLWIDMLCGMTACLLIAITLRMRGIHQKKQEKIGIAILVLCCCVAALIGQFLLLSQIRNAAAAELALPYERNVVFSGMIEKTSAGASGQQKLTMRLLTYESLGQKYRCNKKLRCVLNYYGQDEGMPGDIIEFRAKLHRLKRATNPGEKDRSLSDQSKSIFGYASTGRIAVLQDEVQGREEGFAAATAASNMPVLFVRFRQEMADRLSIGLTAGLPEKEAIVLKGFVLGDVDGLDETIKQDFLRAGVYHILSVSGLHVSFLILLLSGCITFVKAGKKPAFVLLFVVLVLYAYVTGAEAPIIRSVLMGVIAAAAAVFSRKVDGYTTLALSALVVLFVQPLLLFTPSFQLSFVGTLAMMLAAALPVQLPRVSPKCRWIFESIFISAVVVLINAPVTAYHFGDCSLAGIFANLAAIPLSGLSVCLGMLASICGIVSPLFAACINSSNYLLLIAIEKLAAFFANIDGLYLENLHVAIAQAVGIVLFGCIVMVFWSEILTMLKRGIRRTGWRKRLSVFIGFVVVPIVCIVIVTGYSCDHRAHFVFLDVGQGDCLMLVTPDRHCLLFDAGGDKSKTLLSDIIMPAYRYYGCRQVDAVFITHPHKDHMSALAEIGGMQRLKTKVYLGGGSEEAYFKEADAMTTEVILNPQAVASCDIIKLQGEREFMTDDGMSVSCIVPPGDASDDNDDSMLLKITYKDFSCLVTGDAGKSVMDCATDGFLDCDILKVPHHGANNTATDRLAAIKEMKCAIISCGEGNPYGHPAEGTILAYNKAGKRLLRTDKSGGIDFSTDGKGMCIKWFRR